MKNRRHWLVLVVLGFVFDFAGVFEDEDENEDDGAFGEACPELAQVSREQLFEQTL